MNALAQKQQLIQILLAKAERYRGDPTEANFISLRNTAAILYESGWLQGHIEGQISGINEMIELDEEIKLL